jgi:hypothetical protein
MYTFRRDSASPAALSMHPIPYPPLSSPFPVLPHALHETDRPPSLWQADRGLVGGLQAFVEDYAAYAREHHNVTFGEIILTAHKADVLMWLMTCSDRHPPPHPAHPSVLTPNYAPSESSYLNHDPPPPFLPPLSGPAGTGRPSAGCCWGWLRPAACPTSYARARSATSSWRSAQYSAIFSSWRSARARAGLRQGRQPTRGAAAADWFGPGVGSQPRAGPGQRGLRVEGAGGDARVPWGGGPRCRCRTASGGRVVRLYKAGRVVSAGPGRFNRAGPGKLCRAGPGASRTRHAPPKALTSPFAAAAQAEQKPRVGVKRSPSTESLPDQPPAGGGGGGANDSTLVDLIRTGGGALATEAELVAAVCSGGS